MKYRIFVINNKYPMQLLLIDNYDSFTYNLAHLVKELGVNVEVLRNDRFKLEFLKTGINQKSEWVISIPLKQSNKRY